MNKYYCASEPDLRFYLNYSFEIGDVNGDGSPSDSRREVHLKAYLPHNSVQMV